MKFILSIFILLTVAAALPPTPTVVKKPALASATAKKGGEVLTAHATVQSLAVVQPVTTSVTLAWNNPPTNCFDSTILMESQDFVTWYPIVLCASTVSNVTVIQTNSVGIFTIRSVLTSPPSNCVTNNLTIKSP